MSAARTATCAALLLAALVGAGWAAAREGQTSPAEAARVGWPQWMGPCGNGAALDCGHALVADFGKAKKLWKSEPLPDGRAADGSDKVQAGVSGGFASPIVADGRVYFFYYAPSGSVHDAGMAARDYQYSNGVTKDKWLISADDIVICLDAATGQTLWKQVFADKGINWMAFNKGGPQLTPAAAAGKVFALGTMGRLYALDAATGKPLWESNLGPRFAQMEQLKKDCLETRRIPAFNRDCANHVCVADGAVLVCDNVHYKVIPPKDRGAGDGWVYHYESGNGVAAFDGETGKQLWALPNSLAGTPVRWVHQDKEYAVFGNREKVRCVAPRTGAVLWEIAAGHGGASLSVGPEHLLCELGAAETAQLACFRISPTKAEQLWTLPAQYGCPRGKPPVIYRGHVYAQTSTAQLVCVELESGKLKAAVPCKTGMGFGMAAEGLLFMQVDAGHVKPEALVFRADPENLKQLATWVLPSAGCYTVAINHPIVDGKLYLRAKDALECYDLK
jgi:outer membrane protein assembly factor BamB